MGRIGPMGPMGHINSISPIGLMFYQTLRRGALAEHEDEYDWGLARRRQTLGDFYRMRDRICNELEAINRSSRFSGQRDYE